MQKYALVEKFLGYQNKTDQTNLPPGVLVEGSRNVLTNDGERVAVREGYTLDGEANAALTPIMSSYDWLRHSGDFRHLRSHEGVLEYRYVDSDENVSWRNLASGFSSAVEFNFAEFWDPTELIDRLCMVNGTSNIYDWSGGVSTYASATVNTLTKEGAATWAEGGYYTAGTRTVVLGGIVYTYTGGEATTTLTGVSPDPTLGGHTAGDVIHQSLRTTPNSAITDLPDDLANDLISVLNNQIYIGSFVNRTVYVSKQNSITDFSFSSPRTPAQGALITLDATPVGFIPQEENMYITAGQSLWYLVSFTLSADLQGETLVILRLKTGEQQAAQSQAMITKNKNDVVFVSNEPTIASLGRIELVEKPQVKNISDPIKNDMEVYDFTDASTIYFQDYMYVAVPREGLVLMFNIAKGWWEAPQILPISRFAIIDGELYGHSSVVPETYKLFDGVNDNGAPIDAKAYFSYQQFGDRANKKFFNEFYSEGYISSNTLLTLRLLYEYQGAARIAEYVINGSDASILFYKTSDGSLGKQSLGKMSLAGRNTSVSTLLPPKYRVIKTFPSLDFYEVQVQYESSGDDQHWELLAWGPNALLSKAEGTNLKQ